MSNTVVLYVIARHVELDGLQATGNLLLRAGLRPSGGVSVVPMPPDKMLVPGAPPVRYAQVWSVSRPLNADQIALLVRSEMIEDPRPARGPEPS